MNSSSMPDKRVLIIGLDGATWDIINPLLKENKLPNLARLVNKGIIANLTSVLPIISSVAWTSFATGVNPGKHGIFGYQQCDRESYKTYITTSEDIHEKWFWEILSEHGKKVIIINVPGTYPPRKVNGILIAGEVAPDISVYPPELASWLKRKGYKVEAKGYVVTPKDEFIQDIYYTTEKRAEIALELMKREEWDLFLIVFTELDRIQHALWEDMERGDPKYGDEIFKYYQKLDEIVGEMVESVDKNTTIIVMSDHGFGRLKKRVWIDVWLKENGFLKVKFSIKNLWNELLVKLSSFLRKIGLSQPVREAFKKLGLGFILLKSPQIEVDIEHSKAFTCGYYEGPIWINKALLNQTEYQRVREKIIEGIKNLKDPESNKPIAKAVFTKEEIYDGEALENAPDILILSNEDYSVVGGLGFSGIFEPNLEEKATHRLNGILIVVDGEKKPLPSASIMDIAPTVLHIFNISTDRMDGKIIHHFE